MEDQLHGSALDLGVADRNRRVRSHPSGVGAQVAVEDALVVLAGRQGQEAARLAGQARTALQKRGVLGLAREMINYVQWQLMQRVQ